MRLEAPAPSPAPVRLADYRPPDFQVDTVDLDFRLDPAATRVGARLTLRRTGPAEAPLRLDGVGLKLVSIALDGAALAAGDYELDDESLTIAGVPDAFTLETEVEIAPADNTAFEGLYISGGRFCTQCEAESFRKITWFPDRPDVLARYTVRVEGPVATCPWLLSNGNLIERGAQGDDRHFAVWSDPFPKPCYLFALVAGALDELRDDFVTASGREVALRIYVDPGQAPRALYAMDALKRAMRWDETAYGREYDLDLFMIVAVRDFNFGAMENKGLNIFNSSLLLADPETATDLDYERIESVIAHEYFHNWSGDRVTCRDWFQLCLKEGFTVYRDQGFSADMRGAAVQRIKDVRALRARQFPEDAGPLAHPVRPTSYLKIDNFYTATIYEKGAELVGLLHTLVGAAVFRQACDLFFARCDGQAATLEDFLAAFADASGRDLDHVSQWWVQAGTPHLTIDARYDAGARALTLELAQATAPTPGQPSKSALPIPIRLGLLDEDGAAQSFTDPNGAVRAAECVITLSEAQRRVVLHDVERPPVVSALRGFSAPVRLTLEEPASDRFARMAADPDLFNRWEAGQTLARELILRRAGGDGDELGEERYAEALGRTLTADAAPAFKALALALPSESELAQARTPVDPQALHQAREALRARMAVHLGEALRTLYGAAQSQDEFSPDATAAGLRALRNGVIELLVADASADSAARAERHFDAATTMTDAMGGLGALAIVGGAAFDAALARFYARWEAEPLVIDKWFAVQARDPSPGALARVIELTRHPAFDRRTPNRLRALVASFAAGNPLRFHAPDGSGHRFLAEQVIETDRANPSTAARLVEPLGGWRRYTPELSASLRDALAHIARHGASNNVMELVQKALADA